MQEAIRKAIAGKTGGLVSSDEIDRSLHELMFVMFSSFVLVLFSVYGVLHLWQRNIELSALCGLGVAATLASVVWGRHTRH
jgi:hypothetical protein